MHDRGGKSLFIDAEGRRLVVMMIVAFMTTDSDRSCFVAKKRSAFFAEHFCTIENSSRGPAFAAGDSVFVIFDVGGTDAACLRIDQ